MCSNGDVRLNIGEFLSGYDNLYYSDAMGDRQLARGTVVVCHSQTWGTLCDDQWDNADASVVCSQLQLSPYGIYYIIVHVFCLLAFSPSIYNTKVLLQFKQVNLLTPIGQYY